jgi:hypothetical protein
VLQSLLWIVLVLVLIPVVIAGLGWAGIIKYHREFPKDSWQGKEIARAHTVMYLGLALCVSFRLSNNEVMWFVQIGIGVVVAIFGMILTFVYRKKMRRFAAGQASVNQTGFNSDRA